MNEDSQISEARRPGALGHQHLSDAETKTQQNLNSWRDTSPISQHGTGNQDEDSGVTTIERNTSSNAEHDPYALRQRKHEAKEQSPSQWKQPRGQRKIKK